MALNTLTPSELLLHLGYQVPMVPEQSAAAKEQVLEDAFNSLEHNQYQHAIVPGLPDTWTFQLLDKQNAEDIFWAKTPLEEHSKYSIAHYL